MNNSLSKPRLSLGPVLFNWKPEVWRDFYFKTADESPVARVYVGEVVCSKRFPFFAPHLDAVLQRLKAAGKEVVLSSLSLVMGARDLNQSRDFAKQNDFAVEANDASAMLHLRGKPHMIGPLVNVYNEETITNLAIDGAVNICLPYELPGASIERLAKHAKALGITSEVQVFGRQPLAISARCYHARAHKLTKVNCQFVCDKDRDGMTLKTLDDKPFLAINGLQTMSHTCVNLAGHIAKLADWGVGYLRLSPHSCDMVKVASTFADLIDGRISAAEATAALSHENFGAPFADGFFSGRPGCADTDPATGRGTAR